MKEFQHPIEFIELTGDEQDKFSIASRGGQGTGKSRLAATMPDPIGVIPLDRKTRATVAKISKELGKKILIPKEDFIRVGNPMQLAMMQDDCGKSKKMEFGSVMPDCCSSHFYRWHVNRIKEAAFKFAEMPDKKCKSIVIDTGSQLSQDVLFACYGRTQKIMPRDRGMYNEEMKNIIDSISGKHLLITHKEKEIWKNEKPTDETRASGFGEIGYHVNVEIRHYRGKPVSQDDGSKWKPFLIDIDQCQANAALVGERKALEDEAISFQQLAMLVYPDSDSDAWE